jgi:hypothetical protein
MKVLTPRRLLSADDGREVLDLVCSVYPDVAPERYGNYEPLRLVFDPNDPEQFLAHWHQMVFWRRRRPMVLGAAGLSDSTVTRHGSLSLTIDPSTADVGGLIRLLRAASIRLGADFGYIHLLTDRDVEVGRIAGVVGCLDPQKGIYHLNVTGHQLEKYIPDLYWATVFGGAYARHFGMDRLLSAPAPVVERLSEDCVYIQLSESPFDLETDFDVVDNVRRRVKQHLDMDSFFDPQAGNDHKYNVPEFHLEPLPNKV